jgi:hypothetical protein
MPQTNDELTQNLAQQLCWEVARRDDFFHCLDQLGIVLLAEDIEIIATEELVREGRS